MRNIYLFLVSIMFVTLNAQIINFTDANFKAKLLQANSTNNIAGVGWDGNQATSYVTIDANNNGEIEVNEAAVVTTLIFNNSNINNLSGINYFLNLHYFSCSNNFESGNNNIITTLNLTSLSNLIGFDCINNQITSLNVVGLSNLKSIECSNNQLSTLNISGLNLERFSCNYNSITSLDFTGMLNLNTVSCQNNQLTSLDFSSNPFLFILACGDNNLNFINLKNGYVDEFMGSNNCDGWVNNPNLYVCADEGEATQIQNNLLTYWGQNIQINSYCSFTPGGEYYTIQGNNILDSNNNGCDITDIVYPFLKFQASDGTNNSFTISNTTGTYSINVPAGTHTVTPIMENPTYFTVSPSSATVTFPETIDPFVQNFCVVPNGVHNDLEIVLYANQARPGYDCNYFITYKNKGNIVQSGTIKLVFNDAVLDVMWANPIITSQTVNNLSWSFTNLQPFETGSIVININANSPIETPSLNGGDVISFNANITGDTDENPSNNIALLNQTLVNSYDPNHKTCLEGNIINSSMIGKELHYKIEFENNGTANAQNIVVKDMIDISKYDINSLIPAQSSHQFVTKIGTDGKVEFIFENINLPFDDANNDGFVLFKIKTLPTLSVGGTVSNSASIYFDYNSPIITNTETSTFQTLNNEEFKNYTKLLLYPNPTKDILNIISNDLNDFTSISIFNVMGQVVLTITNPKNIINIKELKTGTYFMQANYNNQYQIIKFLKE